MASVWHAQNAAAAAAAAATSGAASPFVTTQEAASAAAVAATGTRTPTKVGGCATKEILGGFVFAHSLA